MNKNLFPSLSIEKMAAYLDNNLSDTEMHEIRSVLNETEYSPLLEELTSLGGDMSISPSDQELPELDILDTWQIPEIQGQEIDFISSFMDDLSIEDGQDDTILNHDYDSTENHIVGDDN